MASIREQIAASFATLLGGVGKPAGLTIERVRLASLDEAALPHTSVSWLRDRRTDEELDTVLEQELEVHVVVTVLAVAQSPEEELDPHLVWVDKAILADRRLGGLAQNVRLETIELDQEQVQEPYGRAFCQFFVTYHRSETDPEAGAS